MTEFTKKYTETQFDKSLTCSPILHTIKNK